MMNHNLIQTNRFCNDFHDGENVIFCRIDYILNEFEKIRLSKKNVVLIVGNGDKTFDNNIMNFCPDNVKHIFTTNTTCDSDRVTPIPIGVEMEIPASRIGHGGVNENIFEKLPYLLSQKKIFPITTKDKIYGNFNIHTNYDFRNKVKNFILGIPHIFFEYGISYENFVVGVKNGMATLSPRGNGIECLRTYEVLYLNEIPIVVGNLKEYNVIYEKIYKHLPIVFIEDLNELNNLSSIEKKIKSVENKSKEMVDYYYWKDKISKKINSTI